MLNWVEHEKSFITSGPELTVQQNFELIFLMNDHKAAVCFSVGMVKLTDITLT